MRKGNNLSKEVLIEKDNCEHRVIIPLYIPNEEGYYKDSYQIFEYCLFSLLKTSLTKLKVSVVSNNSCESVNDKLYNLNKQGYINELIIEKEAIGKINSVLKALRTAEERLITITDADVLFCDGWEKAVLDVFNSFPKAGAVSPVPVFRNHLYFTTNIWFKYFFSNKLYFRPVKNPKAMTEFARSIGWGGTLDERYKDVIGTLKADNKTLAVVGCPHFVTTYKREVFFELPKENSKFKLGGDSEILYTDEPVIKSGGYRLSTYDNYAYHMGNAFEPWMGELYSKIKEEKKYEVDYNSIPKLKKSIIPYFFYQKIFKKIFYIRKFYRFILRYKGLSIEQSYYFVSKKQK